MLWSFVVLAIAVSAGLYHQYTHVWYPHTRAQPVIRNWDGMYRFEPKVGVVYPANTAEVVSLVKNSTYKLKLVCISWYVQCST